MCELVFEEVATNIIRHGYPDGGEHEIDVSLDVDQDALVLCFEDDGIPFDPRETTGRPHPVGGPSETLGGRGLLLIDKAAKSLNYERTPQGRNRLTVTVALP